MGGSFIDYQVLYTDQIPTTPIRLGQLLVDESEAAPLDMLKYCSSLSPLTYTSFSDGILPLIPVGANPSAQVGLSAVNGSAGTFMRSDAAPPLDVGISPTWTGAHTWTTNTQIINAVRVPINQGSHFDSGASPAIFRTTTGFPTPVGVSATGTLVLQPRVDGTVGSVSIVTGEYGVNQGTNFACYHDGTTRIVKVQADNTELRFGSGSDDFAIYHDGTNNCIDSNTGALNLRDSGGTTKIELNTTGLGFNGATPIARPNYTITNPSTSRSLDVGAATLAQLRAVVGTMIQDLIDYGLYQ